MSKTKKYTDLLDDMYKDSSVEINNSTSLNILPIVKENNMAFIIKHDKFFVASFLFLAFLLIIHLLKSQIPHNLLVRHLIMTAFIAYALIEHYNLTRKR
jgi:hypothetical protein